MSSAGSFFTGALIGIALLAVLRETSNAIAARRKRRRERMIAEAEQQAQAAIEAAVAHIAAQFRANVVANQAAFEEHRKTCPCEECSRWRTWAAGRNN